MVLLIGFTLSACLPGQQLEGKTSEEWMSEFRRMETKHNVVRDDYSRFRDCVSGIEPGFFKSDNAVVDEIKACLDSNPF